MPAHKNQSASAVAATHSNGVDRRLGSRYNVHNVERCVDFATIAVDKQLNRGAVFDRLVLIFHVVAHNLVADATEGIINAVVPDDNSIVAVAIELEQVGVGKVLIKQPFNSTKVNRNIVKHS